MCGHQPTPHIAGGGEASSEASQAAVSPTELESFLRAPVREDFEGVKRGDIPHHKLTWIIYLTHLERFTDMQWDRRRREEKPLSVGIFSKFILTDRLDL